jgi:hypothetical protein
LNAKRELYYLLLGKDVHLLSDEELDMMTALSQDKEIQKILQDALGRPKI